MGAGDGAAVLEGRGVERRTVASGSRMRWVGDGSRARPIARRSDADDSRRSASFEGYCVYPRQSP